MVTRREKMLETAAELYRGFTGMEPETLERDELPRVEVAVLIGEIEQIAYNTVRQHAEGERPKRHRYRHTFKPAARPRFAVSHDGKVLLILGDQFRFTERGITDK